ncbi:hypothetical protein L9F63_028035, partial [Diploptera punctata]
YTFSDPSSLTTSSPVGWQLSTRGGHSSPTSTICFPSHAAKKLMRSHNFYGVLSCSDLDASVRGSLAIKKNIERRLHGYVQEEADFFTGRHKKVFRASHLTHTLQLLGRRHAPHLNCARALFIIRGFFDSRIGVREKKLRLFDVCC